MLRGEIHAKGGTGSQVFGAKTGPDHTQGSPRRAHDWSELDHTFFSKQSCWSGKNRTSSDFFPNFGPDL